jgi:hypothetical protein
MELGALLTNEDKATQENQCSLVKNTRPTDTFSSSKNFTADPSIRLTNA